MLSVYQHWDPLKLCVVGRSYPPEFYSWITIPHVRKLFEKIAIETEEDYQNLIRVLQSFGVKVMRPDLPVDSFVDGKYVSPPMNPRDYTVMIGNTFYENYSTNFPAQKYRDIKDDLWPSCNSWHEFDELPDRIKQECTEMFGFPRQQIFRSEYNKIFSYIIDQGNVVKTNQSYVNGAMVARIGKDLFFGTETYNQELIKLRKKIDFEFTSTRNHVINTGGHSDATYCPVCPGLIISLHDVPTYKDTFPDWEVVYLPHQSWAKVKPFLLLKKKNAGKWWIPGFEHDQQVIDTVEVWLKHWTGHVEETVFDVNMLIVDPKNVIVSGHNKQVFDALERYGITPHIVPFRHRYFWDGGIHCVTSDLHREGQMENFFK